MALPEKISDLSCLDQLSGIQNLTVLEFYSPCNASSFIIKQMLESIRRDFKGKVTFYAVNLDQNPLIGRKMFVDDTPALVFLKNGEVINVIRGISSKTFIYNTIKKLV